MTSNSTVTFDDDQVMNDAALPLGVGLSAHDKRPKYSLIAAPLLAFLVGRINPAERLSSFANCRPTLLAETASIKLF